MTIVFRLLSNFILCLNEMTQCHLILLLSTVFASAALVSLLAGSSLEGTELSSSLVFGGCFAAVLRRWVPGHVRQHMIMVFYDSAGTPERRGQRPWFICSVAGARTRFLAWQSFPTLIKGREPCHFFLLPAGCLCCCFGVLGRHSIAKGVY